MLTEIHVRHLGVIEDLPLGLGPGMTALTGETGAGKTLIVEALELLVGGRADAQMVRSGAAAATVEGRFVFKERIADGETDTEMVLSREIPAEGRSRAYVSGRMATVQTLAMVGEGLVDLHGQHTHQSLLHAAAQRRALDHFAGADTSDVEGLEEEIRQITRRVQDLGGDERALAREVDLLRFQLNELDTARLERAGEEEDLAREADLLESAEQLKHAAEHSRQLLSGLDSQGDGPDRGASSLVAAAAAALGRHVQLEDLAERLAGAATELEDVAEELRRRSEGFEADPQRLGWVDERRHLLGELRRKYGDTLEAVMSFREEVRARLSDLEAGEERRRELLAELSELRSQLGEAEAKLRSVRFAAAPTLAREIESHLHELAMPGASFKVEVAGIRGEEVSFLLGANPGEPSLPLVKVASGGELARAMLATRLVLSEAPPTLVFDEVDAGVGGEAALAVGRALAEIAKDHQVLVVTHLAQVAAFASEQVVVRKQSKGGRTVATAEGVTGESRLKELSRMLSGQPDSEAARLHAQELLEAAGQMRDPVSAQYF